MFDQAIKHGKYCATHKICQIQTVKSVESRLILRPFVINTLFCADKSHIWRFDKTHSEIGTHKLNSIHMTFFFEDLVTVFDKIRQSCWNAVRLAGRFWLGTKSNGMVLSTATTKREAKRTIRFDSKFWYILCTVHIWQPFDFIAQGCYAEWKTKRNKRCWFHSISRLCAGFAATFVANVLCVGIRIA